MTYISPQNTRGGRIALECACAEHQSVSYFAVQLFGTTLACALRLRAAAREREEKEKRKKNLVIYKVRVSDDENVENKRKKIY